MLYDCLTYCALGILCFWCYYLLLLMIYTNEGCNKLKILTLITFQRSIHIDKILHFIQYFNIFQNFSSREFHFSSFLAVYYSHHSPNHSLRSFVFHPLQYRIARSKDNGLKCENQLKVMRVLSI